MPTQDSAKYLIHADITASGVVERSDVVGAIFGQTEGLLGEELDLRSLQESSKVGRIDVEIASEGGRSYGTVTIASGLDRAETAVLAAALETIDRVGPCRAEFEVTELEDARAAKRRAVVERATELLSEFEESALSSRELVEVVRQNVRVEDITEYEGLPAGPRVADSDAIIVVEGRADVLRLLRYGIKTAVAVEGTDVPEAVAELTTDRTVTAFLDGDRGGDLILKELAQVGAVDYVTFAPPGRSVEELSRSEVLSALRQKTPYDQIADAESPRDALADGDAGVARTDGAPASDPVTDVGGEPSPETATPAEPDRSEAATSASGGTDATEPAESVAAAGATADTDDTSAGEAVDDAGSAASTGSAPTAEPDDSPPESGRSDPSERGADESEDGGTGADDGGAETLADHVEAVIEAGSGRVRLLDGDYGVLAETDAAGAFDAIERADVVPSAVVLDGELSQRVLDVAAQRGVGQIVAHEEGEFVKQPTSVRVRTADTGGG
jgi:DNA primase